MGYRYTTIRARARQPSASARSRRGDLGTALRDALATRGALHRASVATFAALRPAEGQRCGFRHQIEVGTRQLFSAPWYRRAAANARYTRLAVHRARRTARRTRGRRSIRPDLVFEAGAERA